MPVSCIDPVHRDDMNLPFPRRRIGHTSAAPRCSQSSLERELTQVLPSLRNSGYERNPASLVLVFTQFT